METIDSSRRTTLRSVLPAVALFVLLALFYYTETPGDIPWLRISLLMAVLLCYNLISARMLRGTGSKLKNAAKKPGEATPEQIEESLRFAWSRPMVIKFLGGLSGFSLIAALIMPAVWKGGFHTGLFILCALLCYVAVVLPFAVRIVYYRLRYGQWLFNYSAAKARELGHDR